MGREGIAHRGVFAAEAEVVKRRRKEAIDGQENGALWTVVEVSWRGTAQISRAESGTTI